jgi:hypothetical protein
MKITLKYSLGVLMLLISPWIAAQSVILEELSLQTINERKEALRIKKAETEYKRAAMLEEASRLGIPVIIESKDGTFIELQEIENGIPLYYSTNNSIAANSISTNKVFPGGSAGLSLTGSGETLGIWDGGGVRTTHDQLIGRVTQKDVPSALSSHATHVAGTMIGSGSGVASARGMSYQGQLVAYDWNDDLLEMNLEALNGLRVSNHSYGYTRGWKYDSGTGNWTWYGNNQISNTEEYLYGFYDARAQAWDTLANKYPYYLIVKSAGNDRTVGPAPGTLHTYYDYTIGSWTTSTATRDNNGNYDCIAHNAVSKNVLTVGSVRDIPYGYTHYLDVALVPSSGCGPTDDGRIKPDLVANGYEVISASSTSNSSYATATGTSMATPGISGSIGLLNQHQKNLYGGHVFRASTMKALLIHTADPTGGYPGPNYRFGWGVMNTSRAATLMSKDAQDCINIKEFLLVEGGKLELPIKKKGTEPLKVTIVWNDPAGQPPTPSLNPSKRMLVNDLDLRVSAQGTTYMPFVQGGLAAPGYAATTGDNNVDNVEQVYIDNTDNGIYLVTISHKDTLAGGAQIVSIIVSGNDTIPDQLTFNAPTVNNTQSYWAHNWMTLQNNFNVSTSGSVELAAGSRIDLNPGFRSELGSHFHTHINDRLRCVSGVFMRKGYTDSDYLHKWTEPQKQLHYSTSASPNPVVESTTLKYFLTSSEHTTFIDIVNIQGIVVDKVEISKQSDGWNEYLYNATHLAKGMYIYNLRSGQETYSGKFIKQ